MSDSPFLYGMPSVFIRVDEPSNADAVGLNDEGEPEFWMDLTAPMSTVEVDVDRV